MAGQHQAYVMPGEGRERPPRPAGEGVGGQGAARDLGQQERVVHDDDAHQLRRQGVEAREYALELALAHPAGGAVQVARQPARRLHADDGELGVGPDRLELRRDELAVAVVGPHEPLDRVPLRQVVVAGHGEDRRRQPVEERARGAELLGARRLGEVARDDDQVRPRGLERTHQPFDGRRVDAPEMQVRQVGQPTHSGLVPQARQRPPGSVFEDVGDLQVHQVVLDLAALELDPLVLDPGGGDVAQGLGGPLEALPDRVLEALGRGRGYLGNGGDGHGSSPWFMVPAQLVGQGGR